MKRTILALASATCLFVACNNDNKTADATTTTSSDTTKTVEKKPEAYTMPDSATMMKNWMAYMTPGEVHKMLASWDGNWTGEVSMWHAPNTPPDKSTVSTVNKMMLGGRYQLAINKGMMMGQAFEGQSMLGYDNDKKMFTNVWIDNMGTGVMVMTGTWNEGSKTLTLTGKMVDPSAGNGREINVRQTVKVVDANTQMMEMYCDGPDGKEMKSMEITSKRKM